MVWLKRGGGTLGVGFVWESGDVELDESWLEMLHEPDPLERHIDVDNIRRCTEHSLGMIA